MKSLKNFLLVAATMFATMSFTQGYAQSVKDQLAKAKKNNNTTLLIVTDKNNPADKMNALVKDAVNGLKNISIVQMNIEDVKNADLVKQYKLSGAPMPVLLVFSSKGVMMKGLVETQVTKESIDIAIPTPRYSEISYALSQGKPVFVIVSNNKFKGDKSAKDLCKVAMDEMGNKVETIVVDAEDTKESKLITMLNIKNKLTDTFIIAINSQGVMSGRFGDIPTKAALIQAATKVVQSGCAPGGCGPTCN